MLSSSHGPSSHALALHALASRWLALQWVASQSRASSLRRAQISLWLPVLLLAATHARAEERPASLAARLQTIVDALRIELDVPQPVTVALVKKNVLKASVEPVGEGERFVLRIEKKFAAGLSEEELTGVLAHELGHVWIYTHHPYLQTESLANRVAMRLVSRETLERVYEKVWKDGMKGDLVRFLGEPAPQGSIASAAPAADKAPAKPAAADANVIRH